MTQWRYYTAKSHFSPLCAHRLKGYAHETTAFRALFAPLFAGQRAAAWAIRNKKAPETNAVISGAVKRNIHRNLIARPA
jgi:hypothetical protein